MATTLPAMDLEVAARTIDGASCITIVRQKRATGRGYIYRLSLLVRRTREEDLRDLVQAFGVDGHIAGITVRGGPHFQLIWQGSAAVAVLEAAMPWLDVRKREAKLAIKFWRKGQFEELSGGPAPEDVWAVRDEVYDAMRELKAELAGRPRVKSDHRNLADL